MRKIIMVALFLMLFAYILEHSFFIIRTGTVLAGVAMIGCLIYAMYGISRDR